MQYSDFDVPEEDTRHIGRMIRLWRVELGLTQKDVAERLRVSAQQFQKYEAGVTGIELGRLFEICRVLGKSPAALLNPTPSQTKSNIQDLEHHAPKENPSPSVEMINETTTVVQADISFQISEVVSEFLAIKSPEDRAVALRVLRSLAKNSWRAISGPCVKDSTYKY